MRLKLRPALLDMEKRSYIEGGSTAPAGALDCSEGYNPYGAPLCALSALRAASLRDISSYPQGDILREAVCAYWSGHVCLQKENVLPTAGSIGGIYLANSAFSLEGAQILAFAPHFSDYTAHAAFLGMQCLPVYLEEKEAYRLNPDRLLDGIQQGVSLIYLDHPNNPTGQALERGTLRAVLDKAARFGICVIADEAYGDYMEDACSAATLVLEYDNLMVLRTFSKGWGLAGLRAGYVLAGRPLARALSKLTNPYTVAQPSRIAAVAALGDKQFLLDCRRKNARAKAKLRECLKNGLHMAHTLDTCPICLLYHEEKRLDLAEEFRARGVLTYSGTSFNGLKKNSVRLRLPREEDCGALLEAVRTL